MDITEMLCLIILPNDNYALQMTQASLYECTCKVMNEKLKEKKKKGNNTLLKFWGGVVGLA